MITHVIVELEFPVEEEYWTQVDYSDEYYGIGTPLVMCGECKHLTHSPHKWYCSINRKVVGRDDYCSKAERKDE